MVVVVVVSVVSGVYVTSGNSGATSVVKAIITPYVTSKSGAVPSRLISSVHISASALATLYWKLNTFSEEPCIKVWVFKATVIGVFRLTAIV